jgi:hypothetical protein
MKIKLLFAFLVSGLFWSQTHAQTLNQPAAWPNTNWTVTGTFNTDPLVFESDPTLTANFAFDDDDAGSGSDDSIAAESPVIDLTASGTAGETWITVSAAYVHRYLPFDELVLQYWDADGAVWINWGVPFSSSTPGAPINDYCAATPVSFTTDVLDVASFTATQLSGFKYRISYDDNPAGADYNYGFCFSSPTITSATPSCFNPSTLTVSSVTNTAADLAWTENGTATSWNIELVDITATAIATGIATASGVGNPYNQTGLVLSNDYEYYVQADCGTDGTSLWVGPFPFSTTVACPAPTALTVTAISSTSAALGWTAGASETVWDIELVDVTAAGTATGMATASGVANPYNQTGLVPSNDYEYYVQAACGTDGTSTWAGPFALSTMVACPAPTALTVTAISPTSAALGWTVGGSESVWDIELVDVTAAGTATGMATAFGVANPYNQTGLVPANDYEFYVRSDCGAMNGTSSWSGPFAFTSECEVFVPDSIETFTTFVPDCWKVADGGDLTTGPSNFGTSQWLAENFAHVGTGNGAVDINLFRAVVSDWIISPFYDLSAGGYELNLDVALTDYDNTSAGVMGSDDFVALAYTTDGTSWTALQTWDVNNQPATAGETYNDALTGITGAAVRFGIYATDGAVDDLGIDYDFHIDNFEVRTASVCNDVTAVTIDSFITDSVTVSWTENNTPAGTAWEVIVVPSGDPAPAAGTSNATTNPYTITSLTANTSYDVYIRADCSTTFVGPISLTTSCAVFTAYPYTTDFTNNVPNACWEEATDGTIATGPAGIGASVWRDGRSYEDFSGTVIPSNAMNLYRSSDRAWLISETYDMTGTSNNVLSIEVAVTDYLFTGASDATDTDTMGSDDQVDLLITTDAGMTWTSLMTWTAANRPAVDGTRAFIDLSSYTGTVQFAFFASDGTVNDSEDYDFHVGMFIIDGTAGNEDVLASTLSLYPNPVHGDVVTIRMDSTSASSIEVAVFNTLGQQVMARSYDQVTNSIQIDNLSSLSKGMYFVKISTGGQQATLKFIKE